MPRSPRPMALNAELVARTVRDITDPGPQAGMEYHSDADYAALAEELLRASTCPNLWVFAYGSLIWKPEFEFVEHVPAKARGWHRAFCLKLTRWRGTPEQPGLMMSLERGGSCNGIAYRLPDGNTQAQLERILRRELSVKPPSNTPRWLDIDSDRGKLRALGFTANPQGRAYCGKLSPQEVAHALARACGHWGSGAQYLHQTVTHLDAFGIRDRNLWRLQQLVADEIEAMAESPDA